MVFQQYSLYPHLTVRQNLEFPLKSPILQTPQAEIDRKVGAVAEVLQISHKLDNKATALSGGEMQRVSIGRALVREPSVYLMDEPLSSLDAKLRSDLRIELKSIQADSGATMLYVTHDQTEAMTMATHVGVLDDGSWFNSAARATSMKILSAFMPPADWASRASMCCLSDVFGGAPKNATHIGLRPEQIMQGDGEDSFVQRVEHLGDQTRLHLSFKSHDLITVTDAHTPSKKATSFRSALTSHSILTPLAPEYPRRDTMKQFINAKQDMVTEAIDGTIAASGGSLTRLDGYPHIRVVVRADWDKSKVALVSGGGSGHEPAHAGFVGRAC